MADKKISELTALTSLADDDLLPVVDVSDTTMGAGGTNKKITRENAIQALMPPVIIETGDFTLDPTVHVDGCRVLVDPASGTSFRTVKLMPTATQPSPGYSITVFVTGGASNLGVTANDSSSSVNDSSANAIYFSITYLGSDIWCAIGVNASGFITNADA